MTVQEIIERVKAEYTEIDESITELKTHRADLQRKIDEGNSGFSLAEVKQVAELRPELEQTQKAIERAEIRKETIAQEVSKGVVQEVGAIHRAQKEALNSQYAEKKAHVANLIEQIKVCVQELEQAQEIESQKFKQEASQIMPYLDKKAQHDLSGFFSWCGPVLDVIDPGDQKTVRIIDFIKNTK